MNPPSQPAPQTRAFQSWRWIFLATILLVTVAISTFYFSSAQAQADNGTITGFTLSSDAPGTLTVSWEAASPTPTDYRVDWAKSDEDYQSWKVDEGHKYPAPTATTVTIADLEHDTEYKIRMRARYYRGEHEGKSWGGPWATETITVTGEPAETPTPEPAEEEPAEEEPAEEEPVEEEPVEEEPAEEEPDEEEPDEEEPAEEEPAEEEPVKKKPGQRPARGEPARDEPARDDPAPEDTTPPAGTIDTITATDDAAGQLLLTWTAPAAPDADPTDYHVNWGKSAEDYPADTAEAGNAHPTTTTHTLAGLEYDTEYNIRVRAHYTDGENADSPWNGPWTETTAQVKLPLPAAPSLINTAVTEGQILLSWFNPADDSITGYQILRGPDAGKLVVIEDDTGSSSTSYTDTAPPAGQTHTYGVKARNSAGLSPAGTATATVPEVLVTAASHEDGDNTLVSNLNPTDTVVTRAVVGTHVSFVHERAMSFTTGNNSYGYHLTNSQLYLRISGGSSDPIPGVSIRNDNEGVPGQTVLYTMTTTSAITPPFRLITFTTTDDFTLQPNTKYWLYVTINDGEAISIQQTQSDDENVESNTD